MSDFASLGLAARALQAAQRGLDLTGQNISNVNTPGYSRQRLDQVAQGSSVVPSMWSAGPITGDGVLVRGTQRVRDEFLESHAQQVHGSQALAATTQSTLGSIEGALGEPGSTGLQSQLSSFWNAWHDVANDPTSTAPRAALLANATQLAGAFGRVAGDLDQQWTDSREQLTATVAEVNQSAADVARLNDAIRSATASGVPAHELSDQRDQLVLRLGETAGAVGRLADDGTVTVTIGGTALVSGSHASALAVTGQATRAAGGGAGVAWAASGTPASLGGGTAQGLLTALTETIPSYTDALDAVAASVASTTNTQQAAGYDRAGALGSPLFSGTTAGSLRVAVTDPAGIAASSAPPPAYDGGNASAMAAHLGDATGPDASYRSLVVQLGVQSQSASRQADVQGVVLRQVDTARQGVSSVSLDEEMTNLMSYQHAYAAAARFVTAVDDALSTLMTMTH
ncbi:flagellar hook-associated protein FlgK [Nostocoides sp. HKS02]|uniref:flagellar hook-associated protein FlgK n=1 Tax=Nostocoides sp. HKS02 TaxID=1813880 RepID=UPI0012B4D6D2|nr:flagellar hook-associated protein FlgK [Tetrasphaera sp. HKS02]QGN58029.1 flagellar hook-associated protein FlgK [Tetrasphaera sp. HKS02]